METALTRARRTSTPRIPAPRRAIGVAVVALVATLALTATFIRRAANQHREAERRHADLLADQFVNASPAAAPFLLEQLRPLLPLAHARLQHHFETSPPHSVTRLHAAIGLIERDRRMEGWLLEEVATAPASECENLILGFSHVAASTVSALKERERTTTDRVLRARDAILALHLGDIELTEILLTARKHPDDRLTWIHTYANWHGNPDDIAEFLLRSNNPAVRSGLCAALGNIDSFEQGRLVDVLKELYQSAPDGGTHSAARWTLQQWSVNLPTISPASRPKEGQQWFVNNQGITMLQIPTGRYLMGTAGMAPFDDECPAHEVVIRRPCFLADREVTVDQFLAFVTDSEHPLSEKPQGWQGLRQTNSPTGDCPVQMVSWFDAILYCNWLSLREGRQPCYQRIGRDKIRDYAGHMEEHDVWSCDFEKDGYRLPTEAEWEYAARAATGASYCYGDGTARLSDYAWFRNNSGLRTWPGGMKRPNEWGLFDMHGNVAEWCWDFEGPYSAESTTDPAGPRSGSARIVRGGAAGTGDLGCRSPHRSSHHPAVRNAWNGFRVCCGVSTESQPAGRKSTPTPTIPPSAAGP
jgi:sulfatase modifying factor 1